MPSLMCGLRAWRCTRAPCGATPLRPSRRWGLGCVGWHTTAAAAGAMRLRVLAGRAALSCGLPHCVRHA